MNSFQDLQGKITRVIVRSALIDIVEDFPPGLPRFASLVGAHPAFNVSRRFSTVRARLLLYKQDKVARLEAELYEADRTETKPLFLCSSRRDNNLERKRILGELDEALNDYGTDF